MMACPFTSSSKSYSPRYRYSMASTPSSRHAGAHRSELREGSHVLGDPDLGGVVSQALLEVLLDGHLPLHQPEQGPGHPVLPQDAMTLAFGDSRYLALNGSSAMQGALDMAAFQIKPEKGWARRNLTYFRSSLLPVWLKPRASHGRDGAPRFAGGLQRSEIEVMCSDVSTSDE